jgi:hypothetical protein
MDNRGWGDTRGAGFGLELLAIQSIWLFLTKDLKQKEFFLIVAW